MCYKLTDFKGEIGNLIIITGDFHTSLSIVDKTTKQNLNKEVEDMTILCKQTRHNRYL